MNVLREMRKIKNRNVISRVRLLCIFLVVLIVNTYAWWQTIKVVDISGIEGKVSDWDVEYFVDDTLQEQLYVFETKNFYPGMETFTENVVVHNTGELATTVDYELVSVTLFGEDILEEIKTNNEMNHTEDGVELFTDKDKYPFTVNYTYDKKYLSGTYVDETSPESASAEMIISASWEYSGTDSKDILDTSFGERAYQYYQDHPDGEEGLVIVMKVTATKTGG